MKPEPLCEGMRIGRFVILRDMDGRMHAVAANSVAAACETDDGTLIMLPGGRIVHLARSLEVVVAWLSRGGVRGSE